MSFEWPTLALDNCLDALIDYRGKTPEKTKNGIPLITAKIIKNGRIETPNEFIAKENYETWMRRGVPEPGDVVLTVEAPLGEVAQLGNEKIALAQRVVTLRGKKNFLNSTFLLYWFQSEEAQEKLAARATGTTVVGIKQSELRKVEIKVPPFELQIEVASFLKTLDDRITLLRETNKTLESIAQTIFKSWFVDFDPVRAKMEGRQPEGMDEETAALFPDEFEESKLGSIPKGWMINTVSDLCTTITNGSTPSRSKTQFWEGGAIPWFKTGEFCDGFLIESSEHITEIAIQESSVKLLPKDSILMAIYAAPTVGRLGVLTEESTFNQASTGMVAKRKIGVWFLYWILRFGRTWFNSRANGAAQQNISKAIVAAYQTIVPSEEILTQFHSIADPLHRSICHNSQKIRKLEQIRDAVLPRLVSGKIRLPNAQNLKDTAGIDQ